MPEVSSGDAPHNLYKIFQVPVYTYTCLEKKNNTFLNFYILSLPIVVWFFVDFASKIYL